MSHFTLRQGAVTAQLFEVAYHPAEGFQEDNTWHVAEESLSAEANTKLTDGPATLRHGSNEFPVMVTVLEFESLPGEEEDEFDEDDPACIIEIGYAEGLPNLAMALGLLDR